MFDALGPLEAARLEQQVSLDSERTAKERNEWGQFATPTPLARDIIKYTLEFVPDGPVDFLEPSCGSGSFYSALVSELNPSHFLRKSIGVELDERFVQVAEELWGPLGLEVIQGDFTKFCELSDYRSNLLVANPPYVRHHHMGGDQKERLAAAVMEQLSIRVSGLAGLYVYFVLLSHQMLEDGAVSAWLIPTEFMDVNYGKALRHYLTKNVTLIRIHRFDPADVQFEDALVSSAVVVFRNKPPQPTAKALFTYGGSVDSPREQRDVKVDDLDPASKWSNVHRDGVVAESVGPVLSDFFKIRRGIATGANNFFILPKSKALELGICLSNLRPMLPSSRFIPELIVESDSEGWPILDKQLALVDCRMTENQIETDDPALKSYFDTASELGVRDGYLVRTRKPWFRQENREAAPFLCTYMGRGIDAERPFRFIWNQSNAIATNMFLMLYPIGHLAEMLNDRPHLLGDVHQALLSLTGDDLRDGGRVYGGGLHKIEPKELAALPAHAIVAIAPDELG